MWISVTLNVVLDEVSWINAKVRVLQTLNTHFICPEEQLYPDKQTEMAHVWSRGLNIYQFTRAHTL